MGRPRLDRTVLQVRVAAHTPQKLKKMALEFGYQYGDDGNTGAFLDAVSNIPVEKFRELINN